MSLMRWFSFRATPSLDRYHVRVVTNAAQLASPSGLPVELRYVLAAKPERFDRLRDLVERGYGIGVRIVDTTPQHVLRAVDHISRFTQHNTIIPWLPALLRDEELPVFTREELERAEKESVNLYEDAKCILAERFEFRKIILLDLQNRCIGEEEQRLMREVNEDLYPIAIDAIVHRVLFDNAHERTQIAQAIIKSLILIGPIAHALEHWLSGLGKVFAASADDITSECAELFALRGSGFTWRQLASRSKVLVPVFILATFGAFQVEPLLQRGHLAIAGVVFGFSAVALSLATAIQSVFMYRDAYRALIAEHKLRLTAGVSIMRLALRQDFTNPARLGLFTGALMSPLVAAAVFLFVPSWTSNGWVLALLGSVEAIVAGCTVIIANRVDRVFFQRKMERMIEEL
jgi:hypothetical protein